MSSQVQPTIYKQGLKPHVSFTSLKQLEKFEPQIFAMFKTIKDGERVETADYTYRLRDSGRFGISVTRFTKDRDRDLERERERDQQQAQTNTVVDSGAEARKELAKVAIEPDTKALSSLHEIKKEINTILVAIDLLIARLERQ